MISFKNYLNSFTKQFYTCSKGTLNLINRTFVGHKYAGLQGGWCFCGDDYDKYGQVSDHECHIECPGNSHDLCGGDLRISVYTSGFLGNHRLYKQQKNVLNQQ